MKAIIIDDEANSRDALKGKIKLFCPEVEIMGEAEDVAGAVELCAKGRPDIMFLDINLSGSNGFEILEKLMQDEIRLPEVIFTTAHDEYALQAIKFSAVDYLLKPIDPEELVKAIRKAENRQSFDPSLKLTALMENIRQATDSPKKIVIPSSDGLHLVRISDITRCESSSNYTQFILSNGKSMLASKTLKEFDLMLSKYSFERVHKSHLINMNFVKKYVQSDGGYLVMEDGSKIPVANRKKEQLVHLLRSL